ncbi:hypothetical protein [Rhizobium sp.]|jgi:hypothetical protein|uniref:hypothetical protein n=1 Tax=Rhizobium sp. TaxID=391 RepID=UPI000E873418|nr:hypothetical protein [Rhizobium sp.]
MQAARIPKGLALLKGFSVFNPSEAFIDEFKETWGVKLSFVDDDEELLWIGAPDFRYSFLCFGSLIMNIHIIFIFLCTIYLNLIGNRAYISLFFVLLLMIFIYFFVIFKFSSRCFGVTYVLTNKRIAFSFAQKIDKKLSLFSKKYLTSISYGFSRKNLIDGELYFDVGHLYVLDALILLKDDVGVLAFESFLIERLITSEKYRWGVNKLKVMRRPFLQALDGRFNPSRGIISPFSRFAAIHDASEVARLMDKIRMERIDLENKIPISIQN